MVPYRMELPVKTSNYTRHNFLYSIFAFIKIAFPTFLNSRFYLTSLAISVKERVLYSNQNPFMSVAIRFWIAPPLLTLVLFLYELARAHTFLGLKHIGEKKSSLGIKARNLIYIKRVLVSRIQVIFLKFKVLKGLIHNLRHA